MIVEVKLTSLIHVTLILKVWLLEWNSCGNHLRLMNPLDWRLKEKPLLRMRNALRLGLGVNRFHHKRTSKSLITRRKVLINFGWKCFHGSSDKFSNESFAVTRCLWFRIHGNWGRFWSGLIRSEEMSLHRLFSLMTCYRLSLICWAPYVETIPNPQSQLVSSSILTEHVTRWKLNFNSLCIPKHLGFGLHCGLGRELGCAHDSFLLANCLDFIDSKAQVPS